MENLESIVSKDMLAVSPNTTVVELIKKFASCKTDFAVVLEENLLAGVVSEKDILKLVRIEPMMSMEAVIASNIPERVGKKVVSEIMTTHPIVVEKNTQIEEVIKLIATNSMTHIPVVDNGVFVGVLNVLDIFKEMI
ncbi:MAG: CBS domain-containing protein [Candidatus Aenigmatarchaeota archaeon]